MARERTAKAPRCHTIFYINRPSDDDPNEVDQEWFTTFAKAARRLRRLKLTDSESVHEANVPRSRVALCKWLNTNGSME